MWFNIFVGLVLLSVSFGDLRAGEFKCTFDCTLGGFMPSAKWEATGCSEPYQPTIMAYDVDSYNLAVDEFNMFLSDVDSYLDCVVRDANADIQKNVPKIIKQGVRDAQSETRQLIDALKSQLEMAKINLQ